MRQEDKLKEIVGTKLPYTVPEGYFKSFKESLMESLPAYPEKPAKVKLSLWQKVKPYVYLAAMFAGVWCMMHIFHHFGSTKGVASEDMPAAIASYEPDSFDYYIESSYGEDIELEDEVMSLYASMDDFKKDFYAQI